MRVWSDADLFSRLVSDTGWSVEYKLDGYRCIVNWTHNGIFGWSRHGRSQVLVPEVRAVLDRLEVPEGTAIDGELIGPRHAGTRPVFVGFDVPVWKGEPDRTSTYDERRARLRDLGIPVVGCMPNQPQSFERALAAGHEGLVLKRRDSVYPFASGPVDENTTSWIKVKPPTVHGRIERTGT
jgi:ATP-dependent DNA ligase